MAVFEYRGILATSGKSVKGLRDAENVKALRTTLRKDGILLTTAAEEQEAKDAKRGHLDLKRWFDRPNVTDVAIMTRQLATLVRAKIPLFESLSALIEQVEKDGLRRALTNVRDSVREGTSFADALAEHPKIFGDTYVNMVRAGEASGTLEKVLDRLTGFMEEQAKLKSKLTSALAYPALMVVVGGILIGVLMVTVVPKVTAMYDGMKQALPWYTMTLIGVSGFLSGYWWLLAIVCIGAAVGFRRWRASDEGRLRWDRFVLDTPLFGPLVMMVSIARFSRTLATLLTAGVALIPAMGIVRKVLGNTALEKVIEEASTSIREGQSIADPLKASGRFPPLVTHMIAIGEKSGQLEEMLENVADAYDSVVDHRVQMLTSLLQPLIIVVMAGAVAFIAFSILMPMVQAGEFLD